MLYEISSTTLKHIRAFVLILVLLENALRVATTTQKYEQIDVLILVLLENALRAFLGLRK